MLEIMTTLRVREGKLKKRLGGPQGGACKAHEGAEGLRRELTGRVQEDSRGVKSRLLIPPKQATMPTQG